MRYFPFLVNFLFYAEITFAQAGKIDSSFGIDGNIEIPYISNYYNSNAGMAIQKDEKILICSGHYYQPFTVIRFNSDGNVDSSFGQNGIASVLIGFERYNHDLAIQPDGKILICGYVDNLAAIERLNEDGTIDAAFGDSGIFSIPLNPFYDYGFSGVTVSKDKIVAVGSVNFGGISNFGIVQIDYSGNLDTSFNKNGKLIFHIGGHSNLNFPTSVQIDSMDKITVSGGSALAGFSDTTVIFRINKKGSMDSSFDGNGIFCHSFYKAGSAEEDEFPNDMQILDDDKIVITGSYQIIYHYRTLFALRVDSSGKIDSTFSNNGVFTFSNLMKSETGTSLSIDSKNRIIIADMEVDNTAHSINLILRLNEDGTQDPTFGNNGMSSIELTPVDDPVNLVSEKDGRILLEGQSQIRFDSGIVFLVRFLGDNIATGTLNFTSQSISAFIYPNPIHSAETLQYSLAQDENLSINLYDVNGRVVQSFFTNKKRTAGDHSEQLNFNSSLPAGNYVLVVSNGKNSISIKVVKGEK